MKIQIQAVCRPEARLDAVAAPELVDFYEGPHIEREKRQFPYFLKVDLAHTVMLAEQRILTADQARSILKGITQIQREGLEELEIDYLRGSMLFQIEQKLFSIIGEDVGGLMHIGRSRLDQGPTARRLYKREQMLKVFAAINALRGEILDLAERHKNTLMPGYTCLQHAHPGVLAHYLASIANKLGTDFDRLTESYKRLNQSPLGGSGLSGTSWPIERNRTAALLGFRGLVRNSRIVREAYYAAEAIGDLSMVMSTLNDFATDLHLWSSFEFGFVELGDAFCGTSSIFPQKKNPTALEAVKFAAGEAVNWMGSVLATFRAEGTGDIMMREVPQIDRAFETVTGSLRLLTAALKSISIDTRRMREFADANWSTSTNLADLMVREGGYSFRAAHNIVARLVRLALARDVPASEVTGALADEAARELRLPEPKLSDAAMRASLDVASFAEGRISEGGIGPAQTHGLIAEERVSLQRSIAWLAAEKKALAAADDQLTARVSEMIG